jgi:hypothetical protein
LFLNALDRQTVRPDPVFSVGQDARLSLLACESPLGGVKRTVLAYYDERIDNGRHLFYIQELLDSEDL